MRSGREDWPYGVCGGREGSPLDGSPTVAAVVPQDDLSRVSTPHHKVGMKPGEPRGHYGRLREEKSQEEKKKKAKPAPRKQG